MSHDTNWDIEKYRDSHESDEHWDLRRLFMERWKENYDEDRLVCLARVFANIELMGCRYPNEVMKQVAELSHEVAQAYRSSRKNKLKRTFVSASDAAEDRAKGVRREGGVVVSNPKSARINFVPQGHIVEATEKTSDNENTSDIEERHKEDTDINNKIEQSAVKVTYDYMNEMSCVPCLDVRSFHDGMFDTPFGRLVLLIRTWTNKYCNVYSSCQLCKLPLVSSYENGVFTISINGILLASATGINRTEARNKAEPMVWNRLVQESVSVLVKEQFIAHGDARISVDEVAGRGRGDAFGQPIESHVAAKMMKLMGWRGGGLGADAQGIAEPIKPNLQMVNREGLGSSSSDIRQIRRSAQELMRRYIASDALDVDLVFSAEFSKEERAALHQVAQRAGLQSRSYGDTDRFLVVKKKINPFALATAVIEKGGNTPKYQVFIPMTLRNKRRKNK